MQDTSSGANRADIRHHEDIPLGEPLAFGRKVLTKDEIIAFGRAFDPQPMHVDEEAAKATLVGGLCASGWHTCGIMMRLLCDGLISRMAGLGSFGVDEVRWKKPVRPGSVLSLRYTAQEKELEEQIDSISRKHQFKITGHSFELSGVCNDCAIHPAA